jgi:predicted nucleic acid-binding protein
VPAAEVHGLIDTGAMVAILDRSDEWHGPCLETLSSLRLPFATTAAVLAELFHMVGDDPRGIAAAWAFLRSGAVVMVPVDERDLPGLEVLMKRYADRPMDFADATLVHLAERDSLTTVFTTDHDDFETYRIGKRGRFRIVPGRSRS